MPVFGCARTRSTWKLQNCILLRRITTLPTRKDFGFKTNVLPARHLTDWLAKRFPNDEERTDWFGLHGKEPPQEWLKSSLSVLAKQFDSDTHQVQMAMAVLPDFAIETGVFLSNSEKTKRTPKLRAKQWIDVHAKDLQYDPITHTLVLRMKK